MTREELEEAYRTYAKSVYVYLIKRLNDRDEAADVLHDTFVRLFSSEKAGNVENLASYIFRIAHNLSIDRINRRNRHTPITNEVTDQQTVEQSSDLADEMTAMLNRALSMLDEQSREVVILKDYEGLSFSEISKILNEPEGALRTRCWRARRRLREILLPYLEDRR